MFSSFFILFYCALVTAHSTGDPRETWGGPGGRCQIAHGGNNIGNGNGGGIDAAGDVGIGGGGIGGGCDPASCDAQVGHGITEEAISMLTCCFMKVQKFGIPIRFLWNRKWISQLTWTYPRTVYRVSLFLIVLGFQSRLEADME